MIFTILNFLRDDDEILPAYSINADDGAKLKVRASIPKKPKKVKKKTNNRRKAMLQAFVKSIGKGK